MTAIASMLVHTVTVRNQTVTGSEDSWGQPVETTVDTEGIRCRIEGLHSKTDVGYPMEREGVSVMLRGFFLTSAPIQHESIVLFGSRTLLVVTSPEPVAGLDNHLQVVLKEVQ
jgi:hypothetical protein